MHGLLQRLLLVLSNSRHHQQDHHWYPRSKADRSGRSPTSFHSRQRPLFHWCLLPRLGCQHSLCCIGATLRCIPVASPHRNALLERQHSGLKKSLKALCAEHPESWPAYVTKAQRRINTRSTYGYSPQELFYGFDALTPFSRRFEDVSNTIDEDSVRFEARRRDRERQRMVDSTLNVMEKMRADALSRINPSTYTRQVARRRLFKVGDSVMKWVRNVDPLTPSWRGPLLVQQVLGDSTYKLSDGTVQDSRNMRKYFGKAQNMNPITIAYIQ